MSDKRDDSFCCEYLTKFIGIKTETIKELLANDYNSIQSLLALDLDLDLGRLPNVSMGQKSLLRKALIRLRQHYNQWTDEKDIDSTPNKLQLNSTPINANKQNSVSFVENDNSVKRLVESAFKKNLKANGSRVLASKTPKSCFGLMSVSKTHELSLSPVKSDLNQNKTKNKRQTINQFNNSSTKSSPKKSKRRMKRKLRYTLPPSKTRRIPRQSINRCLSIDIDSNDVEVNENHMSYDKETNVTDNQMNGSSHEMNGSSHELNDNSIQIDTKEEDAEDLSDESFNYWTIMSDKAGKSKYRLKIKSLLMRKSNRIKLMNECLEFKDHYNRIIFDGLTTDFVCCKKCIHVFHFNKQHMDKHMTVCKSIVVDSIAGEDLSKSINPLTSDLDESLANVSSKSTAKRCGDESQTSNDQKKIKTNTKTNGQKSLKTGKEVMTKEDIIKTISKPSIALNKLKFDLNKSTKVCSVNPEVNSIDGITDSIIVKNGFELMSGQPEAVTKAVTKAVPKTYKCDFNGCTFSTAYPFSLSQHRIISHVKPSKGNKTSESVVIHMNRSTVSPNRKSIEGKQLTDISIKGSKSVSNNSNEDSVIKPKSNSGFKPKIKLKLHLLRCQSNGCDFNCMTSDVMNKHMNSDHNNEKKGTFVCQSPGCKYSSVYKIIVKKHMLNYHDMNYVNVGQNSSPNTSLLSNANTFEQSSQNTSLLSNSISIEQNSQNTNVLSNSNAIDENEGKSITEKIVHKLQKLIFS